MTGCSKDAANEQINSGVEEFTLISHADAPDTRMVINGDKANGFKTAWEDGDQIGVYATDYVDGDKSNSTLYTCNYNHTATIGSDGKATFTGTIRNTSGKTFNLFAYYPYISKDNGGRDYNDTDYQTGAGCSLATVQTMNGNSFDKSCSYMVAKTGLTVATSSQTTSYKVDNWQFRHTVAFINLGIKDITNSAVSGDEIVETVKIEVADKTLAGDFQFNLENGEMTFTDKQSAVIVDVPANTKLSDLSAWFVVNPFELTSADKLVVVINTQSHEITKEVTGKAKSFEAANVYTLNLTIDENCTIPAEDKYELVTDASTLDEGDKIVIVCTDKNVMATTTIKSKYLPSKEVSVSSDKKNVGIVSNDNTGVFTLGGKAGAWTLSNAEGELLGATKVKELAYDSGTTTWSISIDADNKATIQNTQQDYGRFLYNVNNPRFTTYTSNPTTAMFLPCIYKKYTPTIKADDIANVVAAGVTDATATITLKGLDGVTVSATPDGTVVTAASVSGNTLTYTVSKNESSEARTGTITLSAEGADDVTINVSQLAKEAVTLTLSKDAVELEATDVEIHEDITFESDGTVTAAVFDDIAGTNKCNWLVVGVKGSAISYMAEANTGAERVAYIVVTATLDGQTISKSVKVTQKNDSVIYKTEFNYPIKGSAYNSKDEILGEDADGKQWGIVYGNWNQSSCAQLRVYASGGGFGSVYTKFDLTKVTKVKYKAQVSAANLKLNTYYSTDGGKTWIIVDSEKSLTTNETEYTFEISSTGEYETVRIKFEVAGTRPQSKNTTLTIDNVDIYGMK